MSSMTVDTLATSPETGPEQPLASPHLALAEPPAATQPGRPRPLEVAQCSLCGIALPLGLLVPDGGQACCSAGRAAGRLAGAGTACRVTYRSFSWAFTRGELILPPGQRDVIRKGAQIGPGRAMTAVVTGTAMVTPHNRPFRERPGTSARPSPGKRAGQARR